MSGLGFIDTAVPAYTAMIIATSGLISLSISIASYREQGILRRFKATTLRPQAILGSQVTQVFLVTLLGMILLVIAGKIVFHLRFSGNPLSVLAGFVLGSLSFFALGFIIASVTPTTRSSQVTAMVLFYPMLFLSGAAIPRELLPPAVRSVGRFCRSPRSSICCGDCGGEKAGGNIYRKPVFWPGFSSSAC